MYINNKELFITFCLFKKEFILKLSNTHSIHHPPASKASREEANLTERKNAHTPVYGVKEFVCLYACYQIRP